MKATRNIRPLYVLVLCLSLVGVSRSGAAADRSSQLDRVQRAVLSLQYLGVDATSRTRYLNETLEAILDAGFSGETLNLVVETLWIADHATHREIGVVVETVLEELARARDLLQPSEVPTAIQNGDTDGNGEIDITDAILLVEFLLLGGEEPVPSGCEAPVSAPEESYAPRLENGDVNGDGDRDISDFIRLLGWQFVGDEAPVQNSCVAVSG